ncbi:MAG: anti-sigma F factor [Eubacterium sp.]
MSKKNEIIMEFSSNSENESLARTVVSAFVARLDPTLEELADIKTAVSEAVTNAIIHGYEKEPGMVHMYVKMEDNVITIEISDQGAGIENLEKAMEPMYTTKPELDRSGMGFAFMEAFMDELEVQSEPGKGTVIRMKKTIYSAMHIS